MDKVGSNTLDIIRAKRLSGDARRQQIVDAAFAMISETGLERLRTRDVASRVGINPATLHHYFATKELLVEGVAAHLEGLFRKLRASDENAPPSSPQAALRAEFADARYCRRERPEMLAVAAEFSVDAKRARMASATIFRMHEHWRAGIERIIRDGQSGGAVSKAVRPAAASMIVVGALWGATTLLDADDAAFVALCTELEAWLFQPSQERKHDD
jgi:TetR/AcrR family transcriptional regulator, regulator of cefoperazone and chloramphenicol sensitivity